MNDINAYLESLTEEQKAELLATDFGAEMEKEAAADLAKADLAEALYAYGSYIADREVESEEELSKEASEEFDAAHKEITEAIDAGLVASGILENEDTAELHKEAQAAAAIIFKGYSDQIEKIAAKEEKMGKLKKFVSKKLKAGKEHLKSMGKAALKHKGKAGIAAAGLAAGAGAMAYRKHKMEKKAGEMSYEEIREQMIEDQTVDMTVAEGFDKLASIGAHAAKAKDGAMKAMKAGFAKVKSHASAAQKHVGKHSGKYGLGAGAALGATGMAAAKKKD